MEKRRLSRRDFLCLSAAAATGAVVAACAPAAPEVVEVEKEVPVDKVVNETVVATPAPEEKITLRFHGRTATFDDIYVDLCEKYMAEHPNVTIEYERIGEFLQKQLIMAAAGTLGDAAGPNWPYGLFYKFAYNGIYLDHLPLIQAANFDLDALLPQAVEVVTIGGKVYGLPHAVNPGTLGMFVNKTMFEEAGVPIPKMEWTEEAHPGLKDWTYDDALEAALALTKREGGRTVQFGMYIPGGTGDLYTLLLGFGGDFINEEGTKTMLDTPESMAAIQWLADLYNEHKVSPRPADVPTGGPDLFASGKLALKSACVYELEKAAAMYKDVDWMVIPMPRGPYGLSAHLTADVWGVLAASKHPEVTFDVISTFASYETGVRQVKMGGVPGSHIKVWDDPDLLKSPNFAVFARNIKSIDGIRCAANLRTDEWETEYKRLFSPLFIGEVTDVQKLVEEATVRLDEILAKPRAGL